MLKTPLSVCTSITELDLGIMYDDGVECVHMYSISLKDKSRNSIGNRGAVAVAEILMCVQSLKVLNLSCLIIVVIEAEECNLGNHIGCEGAISIGAKLGSLTALQRLDLDGLMFF